jgi:F-type H+-transporting ATPase subunit delta
MKTSRSDRMAAKRLLAGCCPGGQLDEARVRAAVEWVGRERPRHFLQILSHFRRLVGLHLADGTAVVETAVPLGAREAAVTAALRENFGRQLRVRTEVTPGLLGGMRVRVGCDVWDGTVRGRLDTLARSF